MLCLCCLHSLGHVFKLRLVVVDDLFRAALPWTLAENLLHILSIYDLTFYEHLCQLTVSVGVLFKDVLGAGILLVAHLQHLIVDELGCGLRVGALELIFLVVVEADVGQRVAHADVCHHSECALCGTLKVVHGTCRYVSCAEFLGCSSSKQRAHLVEHLFLC